MLKQHFASITRLFAVALVLVGVASQAQAATLSGDVIGMSRDNIAGRFRIRISRTGLSEPVGTLYWTDGASNVTGSAVTLNFHQGRDLDASTGKVDGYSEAKGVSLGLQYTFRNGVLVGRDYVWQNYTVRKYDTSGSVSVSYTATNYRTGISMIPDRTYYGLRGTNIIFAP